jgi:hypothetical protein
MISYYLFPPCNLTYATSASALVGTTLLNLHVHTNQLIATIAVSCDNCCTVRFPTHVVNADNANDMPDLPKRYPKTPITSLPR